MAYKVIRGEFMNDKILNEQASGGWELVDFEEHQGLYTMVFHKDDSDSSSKQTRKK